MKNPFRPSPYPLPGQEGGGNCIWGTPPDPRHPDKSGRPSGLPFFIGLRGASLAMEQEIASLLKSLGLTLAIAESATGGRISDAITSVAGSSDYFLGAVVAYHNRVKAQLLRVPEKTLQEHGAVSGETAEAMAKGVRDLLGADIGLSSTGIAGPTGATSQKPVGLVFLGISSDRGTRSQRFVFQGSREENKESFAKAALALLKEELEDWKIQGS